jgi:hypothetical protein
MPFVPLPEWHALLRYHPNVLLEGGKAAVEETLVAIAAEFYPTRLEWRRPMPQPVGPSTLIVRDIGEWAAGELDTLVEWMAGVRPPLQVVTTSATPLFDRIERGTFPADLYYRLNAVRLVVD